MQMRRQEGFRGMPSDRSPNSRISLTENEGEKDQPLGRRLIPFLAVVIAFVVMAGLYLYGPLEVYRGILRVWGIRPYPFVFLDTDTVLSAVRCLRKGVDVFVTNPCDAEGRVFDYSPLWLLLAKLPASMTELVPTGLIVDAAFFLSLLLLPVGRTWRESGLIAFAAISTASAFAVERANNDLVLFALCAVAAALASRSKGLRLVGYGAALLAGLLKYYPLTTLAIASREKPARFALVVCLVLAFIGLFLATMGHDLHRALKLIPTGIWFGDMFGSSTVAGGLSELLGWSSSMQSLVHIVMCLAALLWALWLATRAEFIAAIDELGETQRHFLLVGALLVISCYFTAQNIGYRSVHLIMIMPSLLALASRPQGSLLLRWSPALALVVLWTEGWRYWVQKLDKIVDASEAIKVATWAVREAVWWTLIPVLIACVTVLLVHSEMGRIVFGLSGKRSAAPKLACGV